MRLAVVGQYLGSITEAKTHLHKFLSLHNPEAHFSRVSYPDAARVYAGKAHRCPFFKLTNGFADQRLLNKNIAPPLRVGEQKNQETKETKDTTCRDVKLKSTVDAIVAILQKEFETAPQGISHLEIDTLLGAITRPEFSSHSIFPARHSPFWFLVQSYWRESGEEVANVHIRWAENIISQLRHVCLSELVYVGVPDLSLGTLQSTDTRYMRAYYGDATTELMQLRRRLDPQQLLIYPQAIPIQ